MDSPFDKAAKGLKLTAKEILALHHPDAAYECGLIDGLRRAAEQDREEAKKWWQQTPMARERAGTHLASAKEHELEADRLSEG